MSIDDNLNPENLIDKMDDLLADANRKIAERWQDATYRSKSELEIGLHITSAATLMATTWAIDSPLFVLPAAIEAIRAVTPYDAPTPDSGLLQGVRGTLYKAFSILGYTLGVGITATGIGTMVMGFMAGDNAMVAESTKKLPLGIGMLSMFTALYMSRSDIGGPPRKKEYAKTVMEPID